MLSFVPVIVGLALLTYGRRLFWLFVGVMGFLAGFSLASQVLQGRQYEVILVVAVAVGLIGIVLALTLQRITLIVAGFAAGGYLAYSLLTMIGYENTWLWLGTFLLFGAVGAALMALLFNSALMLLTSLTGALLVVRALPLPDNALVVIFLVLLAGGLAFQIGQLART